MPHTSDPPLGTAGDDTVEPVETILAVGTVEDPMLAVDAARGAVYAAWTARESGPSSHDHGGHEDSSDGHEGHPHHGEEAAAQVMVAVSHDGGRTFTEPARVDDPDPVEGFSADPRGDRPTQVVVTDDGTVHVVWVATRPIEDQPRPAPDLRIASSDDGGATFGPPRRVVTAEEADAWRPAFHRVIVAPDGALHIAFLASPEEEDTVGRSVRVVTSTDHGASFEAGEAFTTSTCQCCPVAMAADTSGRLALAWRHIFLAQDDATIRDIAAAFSHDGGVTWSAPAAVHDDGWVMEGCPHTGPALVAGPDGRLHVAWYTGRDDDAGIRYAREGAPQHFAEPVTLAGDVFFPITQPSLAVSTDGTAWVAWDDHREDPATVWVARITASGAVVGADEPFTEGRQPRVAVVGGEVLVVWQASDGLRLATLDPAA